MKVTKKVITSRSGNVGKFQLNNPSALHALDLDMIRVMNGILPEYANLKATVLLSRNQLEDGNIVGVKQKKRKAFCAGGDVKSVYMAGMGFNGRIEDMDATKQGRHGYGSKHILTADFFREENLLNLAIATQPPTVPQISIWDGIVMGGGVGISVHGKYRIATENSLFAMPEVGIGLFPDVGSTFFLPRLSLGGLGEYIALTGSNLYADDLMYAGLATHYVPSERIEDMINDIVTKSIEDSDAEGDCAVDILSFYHEEKDNRNDSFLAQHCNVIYETFRGKESVEDVVIALKRLGPDSKFGKKTLDTLKRLSPTSLKVTFEGLKRGRELDDIGKCLQMEYRVTQHFMKKGSDFYEGVRALLIDKDNNPKWNPSKLEDVSEEEVLSYFSSLGKNDLQLSGWNNTTSKL